MSFAIECYEDNVYEPSSTVGSAASGSVFEDCVLQSLFYGLPYDQSDIDFVKQYPQTLNTILGMLGTQSFPPAPPIPGSPNPISPSNPICPEFFNWVANSNVRKMNVGDFSINFLPESGNIPYNLELSNLYFEFYSGIANSPCLANSSQWASSALNTAILEVNYSVTNGNLSNPNVFDPDLEYPLRTKYLIRFGIEYFEAAQKLTVTCGYDQQGVPIITPEMKEETGSLPPTSDFDYIMSQINCQ